MTGPPSYSVIFYHITLAYTRYTVQFSQLLDRNCDDSETAHESASSSCQNCLKYSDWMV